MDKECVVCLEKYYVCKTPCGHDICAGCLILLIDKNCPICRRTLTNIPKPTILGTHIPVNIPS